MMQPKRIRAQPAPRLWIVGTPGEDRYGSSVMGGADRAADRPRRWLWLGRRSAHRSEEGQAPRRDHRHDGEGSREDATLARGGHLGAEGRDRGVAPAGGAAGRPDYGAG